MKRITIREILIGAVASAYNVSEECLKKVKTYKLKQMMEEIANQ